MHHETFCNLEEKRKLTKSNCRQFQNVTFYCASQTRLKSIGLYFRTSYQPPKPWRTYFGCRSARETRPYPVTVLTCRTSTALCSQPGAFSWLWPHSTTSTTLSRSKDSLTLALHSHCVAWEQLRLTYISLHKYQWPKRFLRKASCCFIIYVNMFY